MRNRVVLILTWCAFSVAGLLLFLSTIDNRTFDPDHIVWDTQWINAWSIGFVIVLISTWYLGANRRMNTVLSALSVALWGLVASSLLFNGTPFGWNAY